MSSVQHFQRDGCPFQFSLKNEPKPATTNIFAMSLHAHTRDEQRFRHDGHLCHDFEHQSPCTPAPVPFYVRIGEVSTAKQVKHEIH